MADSHNHIDVQYARLQRRNLQTSRPAILGGKLAAHVRCAASAWLTNTRSRMRLLTYSVQLINEDDTGRFLLGFCKELPHTGGPPPHKQLHKLTG